MKRIIMLLAAAVLTAAQPPAGSRGDERAPAGELVGAYKLVDGERGGKPLGGDDLKDVTVRIAANAITTYDKDKKEVYAATYKLDTSAKPWRITMTATLPPGEGGKGATSEGLVEKNGDTVRLIYALPGGSPPKDFKTGDKQQMFVLKRVEK